MMLDWLLIFIIIACMVSLGRAWDRLDDQEQRIAVLTKDIAHVKKLADERYGEHTNPPK